MRWVIQNNLGKHEDISCMAKACKEIGVEYIEVDAIPFSDDLPNIPNDKPTIFYGAVGFINTVYRSGLWNPGVFFNEEKFRFSTSIENYGTLMLNSDAKLTTMAEFGAFGYPSTEEFFIRPDKDLKEFAGQVITYGEFIDWYDRISHGGFTIGPDCEIIVGEPYNISAEWRLFMAKGKVIGGSQYRVNHRLRPSVDVPPEVFELAELSASRWSPADAFVIDIGKCGKEYYIIECNCFNSSGFYKANIGEIVHEISNLYLV